MQLATYVSDKNAYWWALAAHIPYFQTFVDGRHSLGKVEDKNNKPHVFYKQKCSNSHNLHAVEQYSHTQFQHSVVFYIKASTVHRYNLIASHVYLPIIYT